MGLIHTHLHPSHFELLDALRVFLMLEVSFDPFLFTQDALELDLGPQFDPRGEVFQKRDG